jgi:UDP-glucose 4-epimerase/UDP-glucuronate decarboxylase
MNRIIVTGGAGFIGFHLVKKLLEDKNNSVTIVDNFSSGVRDQALMDLCTENVGRLNIIVSDLYLEKLFWGFDADQVYHLAGAIGTKDTHGDPLKIIEINTISMFNVLYTLGMKGAKILFTSTNEVYAGMTSLIPSVDNPETSPIGFDQPFEDRWGYALSKFIGETLITRFKYNKDFKFVIARLSNVYGPRMLQNYVVKRFIERAMERENPFRVMSSNDTRPLTYVADTVNGLIYLMNSDKANGQVVNIGNSKTIAISDLATLVCNTVGYAPKFVFQDTEKVPEYRKANVDKANSLGWKAKVSIEDGIKDTVAWYLNGKNNR